MSNIAILAKARDKIRKARDIVDYIWTHPSNTGVRTRVLLRSTGFQIRGKAFHKRTLTRLGSTSSIWAYPSRHASAKFVYANPPDRPEQLAWKRTLKPGDLFVDVGANIGAYSIWAYELGAEVIALEPAPDTFRVLQDNIALNGYDATLVRAAAGSSEGVTRFTVGKDAVNRVSADGETEVPVVTIDSLLRGRCAAGLKIDVEGFELDVLLGCSQALSERRIALIQLEWNSTSLINFGTDRQPLAELLAANGYSLFRPDNSGILEPIADIGFGPDVFARPR